MGYMGFPCSAGFYCPENVTTPQACRPGMITISLGAASQDACWLTPVFRGSADGNRTISNCGADISGWCSFTYTERGAIIFGIVLAVVIGICCCCCMLCSGDKMDMYN